MMATQGTARPGARRGLTMVELLMAVLIVSMMAGLAAASWNFSSKVTRSKRVTEMGAYLGIQEMERLKAYKYESLAFTTDASPIIDWYDKDGNYLGRDATSPTSYPAVIGTASTGTYKVKAWVRSLVDRNATADTEDLAELQVQVWNTAATTKYEDIRTVLTFGGI